MIKTCTNIEQSKRLIELGFDVETADMYYMMLDGKPCNGDENLRSTFESEDGKWYDLDIYEDFYEEDCFNGVYAWSFDILWGLMPPVIKGDRLDGFSLNMWKDSTSTIIQYEKTEYPYGKEIQVKGDSPIDAAYEMICWLIENGYIEVNR